MTLVNMRWISFPQCTAYDLLEKGMEVHIVADAVSSRRYFSVCFFLLLLFSLAVNNVPVATVYMCVCLCCTSTARRTVCLPSPG